MKSNDIIFKSPMYQKMKQMNLEVLEVSKNAIKIAKVHDEVYLTALQTSFKTIEGLDILKLAETTGMTQEMDKTIKMLKKNYKMLKDYEDQLCNIELIIKSDGVKN